MALATWYGRNPETFERDVLKGVVSPKGVAPCPSCGHDDVARVSTVFVPTIYVTCCRCYDGPGSPIGAGRTVAEAVESWNDVVELYADTVSGASGSSLADARTANALQPGKRGPEAAGLMTQPEQPTPAKTIDRYLSGELGHSVTRASAEDLAALDAEIDELERLSHAPTEPPGTLPTWCELVRAAVYEVPDVSPFRALRVSLRRHIAESGEHCCGCADNHLSALQSDLHWLSGAFEALWTVKSACRTDLVPILDRLGLAYDALEAAIDRIEAVS